MTVFVKGPRPLRQLELVPTGYLVFRRNPSLESVLVVEVFEVMERLSLYEVQRAEVSQSDLFRPHRFVTYCTWTC